MSRAHNYDNQEYIVYYIHEMNIKVLYRFSTGYFLNMLFELMKFLILF